MLKFLYKTERGYRWRLRFYRVLGLIAIITLASTDFFGLRTATENYSEKLLWRVVAPFYQSEAQEHGVTVVLIDDQTLKAWDQSWPVDYRTQGLLIRNIMRHEPAALFVDLLYTHVHDGGTGGSTARATGQFSSFIRSVARFRGSEDGASSDASDLDPDVRLFAADVAPLEEFRSYNASVNEEARDAFDLLPVEYEGYGNLYPLVMPTGTEDEVRPTPGLRLYQAWCAHTQGANCPAATLGEWPTKFADPMVVAWGSIIHPTMENVADISGCKLVGRDWWSRLREAGAQAYYAIFRQFDPIAQSDRARGLEGTASAYEKGRHECPYTRTLAAEFMLQRGADTDQTFAKFLRGHVVLLGTDIIGSDDRIESPVHGKLPGVYLHAMATDNLMTLGLEYRRPWPDLFEWGPVDIGYDTLVELAMLIPAFALHGWSQRLQYYVTDRRRQALTSGAYLSALRWSITQVIGYLARVALLVLAFGCLLFVLYQVFPYPPVNWLGVFSLALAAPQITFAEPNRARLQEGQHMASHVA